MNSDRKMVLLDLLLALLCAGALWADIREQGPADAEPSGLLAGVARADITPPVGIPQMNWGSQTHVEAVGIDPVGIVATALALSNGEDKYVLVSIEAGSPSALRGAVERASGLTGIDAAHIIVSSVHSHAGPAFRSNKGPAGVDAKKYMTMIDNYNASLADKITGIIVEANSKLQPVHANGGRGTGTININRRFRATGEWPAAVGRNPEGFVDRELVVLRIDDAKGKPLAVLVNFQCHGTVLGYENKFVSPDWPGAARVAVEKSLPGAKFLFLQGAAGNQGPVEGFTGDLEVPHRLGSILGHQAVAVALGIDTVRREPQMEGFVESTAYQAKQPWRVLGPHDATLKSVHRTLELPRRKYSPEEIDLLAQQVSEGRAKLESVRQTADPWKIHQAQARLRRWEGLLARFRRPTNTKPVLAEVRVLRVGNTAIVVMSGEPFAEIGAAVKEASPLETTMFCGYSNLLGGGYMPVESEYAKGGYEVQNSPYGRGAADITIREVTALVREVQ